MRKKRIDYIMWDEKLAGWDLDYGLVGGGGGETGITCTIDRFFSRIF